MVELVVDPSGCHWVIRPNQSLSWRGSVWVYTTIALCCFVIGMVFALHGFWAVLPFAGFEIAVLGIAFYLAVVRSQIQEVVWVNADVVRVEKGRQRSQWHWECPRAWARILLQRSPIAWYPSRLLVAFQGQRVEIGRFLSETERKSLAHELQGIVSRDSWPAAMQ